jgi:hypothetical protein
MPKNETTFLFLNPISSISEQDLIILDDYAFSIKELKLYGKNSFNTFLRNPHEIARNFSEEAINTLENHPLFSEYVQQYKTKIATQKHGISLNTVSAVLDLLLKITAQAAESSLDPRISFLEFKGTLTPVEQNQLDHYIIRLPYHHSLEASARNEANLAFFHPSLKMKKSSPYQERVMTFSDALSGGNQANPCRRTLQIFLWQFVLNFNPPARERIPEEVKRIAAADHYLLGESLENLNGKPTRFSPACSSILEEEELEEANELSYSP